MVKAAIGLFYILLGLWHLVKPNGQRGLLKLWQLSQRTSTASCSGPQMPAWGWSSSPALLGWSSV